MIARDGFPEPLQRPLLQAEILAHRHQQAALQKNAARRLRLHTTMIFLFVAPGFC